MKIVEQISENIRKMLTNVAKECAEASGLITRQGGKVTGENLSQTLVFGWWQNPDASLEALSQMGMTVGLEITPQGLAQRFTEKTANFLKRILAQVIQIQIVGKQTPVEVLKRFSNVYLDDSTSIALPSELAHIWQGLGTKRGATSAVKLQTRIEMTRGTIEGPHLVNERVHDRVASEHHPEIEPNSLRIVDLGYWLLDDWSKIDSAGAYFLTRMKSQVYFQCQGRWWTTHQWVCSLGREQTEFAMTALLGKHKRLKVRIMGKRVPPHIAQQRRRKLKRKHEKMGQTVSQAGLDLCDWTLLVTNAPEEKICFQDAFILFRVRWQIELLFKLWKSHGKIDESRSQNPWRCLSELYAKLIAMLFQQWCFSAIIWQDPARSLTKASCSLRTHLVRLAVALPNQSQLTLVLNDLIRILARRQFVNPRSSNPASFQLLERLARPIS